MLKFDDFDKLLGGTLGAYHGVQDLIDLNAWLRHHFKNNICQSMDISTDYSVSFDAQARKCILNQVSVSVWIISKRM